MQKFDCFCLIDLNDGENFIARSNFVFTIFLHDTIIFNNRFLKKFLPILPILLLAFWLRAADLTLLPPGLTHDEANHGREALGILDGVFLFFFPLNYGSEPLYSYLTAAFMGLVGESIFTLRYVNVVFGTAVLPITYSWVKQAFNRQTALLSIGLLAVSFWPLATSRQALRAGILPFFWGVAVFLFWQLYRPDRSQNRRRIFWLSIGFGTAVATTLHIYLAARVAWVLFPVFVAALFLNQPPRFRKIWLPVGLGLLWAGLLSLPMFIYLRQNPSAQTRLEMLDRSLQEMSLGNLGPIFSNAGEALLALIWPGFGDQFLAYNIPGQPVLDAVTAFFFIVGLLTCLWHWKRPSYLFVLLWFGIGIIPSLLTGSTANTTRNLAALAVIHLIPAIGFVQLGWLAKQTNLKIPSPVLSGLAVIWLLFVGGRTLINYFSVWGELPEVRGAYQQNLVSALNFLENQTLPNAVVISTLYPGPVHDPSIGLVLTAQNPMDNRWVDARYALLMPAVPNSRAVIPQSTPPHPAFNQWLSPLRVVELRPDDLDPFFTLYALDPQIIPINEAVVNFNDAIMLLSAYWLTPQVVPGETAELMTIWRVTDPNKIGPVVPPSFTTDVAMFAQVLNENNAPIAQRDALDAPSWSWHPGDILVQVQPIEIPAATPPGQYSTIIGFYDRPSGSRTPVLHPNQNEETDYTAVAPLIVR